MVLLLPEIVRQLIAQDAYRFSTGCLDVWPEVGTMAVKVWDAEELGWVHQGLAVSIQHQHLCHCCEQVMLQALISC